MEEQKKVMWTAILILIILAAAVGIYFLISQRAKEAPSERAAEEKPLSISPQEELRGKEEAITESLPVELSQSDDFVRALAKELSSHPQFLNWLRNSDLIRRFVAAVDNIANGLSPRHQGEFLVPKGSFRISKKRERLYIHPSSFARYNPIVDVFSSLNSESSVSLYKKLRPLFQEAYKELGYPTGDFDRTLFRAFFELLRVPVVEGEIQVEKDVTTYRFKDEALENMSEAQKHLLRMGAENVQIVQAKLREIAHLLGYLESELPPPRSYFPSREK